MNSKKSILTFCCIICLILTSGNISASYSYITLLNNGGDWAWNQGGMYFGRCSYLGEGTRARTYRTDDLSGYSNDARIDSIRVSFTILNEFGTSNVKVYFVGTVDLSGGYSSQWSAIENGTKYDSLIVGSSPYPYSRTFYTGSDFVDDFTDSLTGSDDFDIGFFSLDAENSATNRSMYIQNHQIIYTIYGTDLGTYRNVLFKNVNESETNIGDTLVVNNSINVLSGNYLTLEDGTEHNVKVKNQVVNYSGDDYQHHNWKNESLYLLSKAFFTYDGNQVGSFKKIEPISIYSNQAVSLSMRDPWYVDPSSGQQENEYHTLSGVEYCVFINENPSFLSDRPIYRLKAPAIGPVTTSDIYVFDRWIGNDVDFGGGATIITDNETDVVFKSAGASVTAHYVSANATGRVVTVLGGETLTLPAGATYTITPGDFKLMIFGGLYINISTTQPVTFQSGAANPTNSDWDGIEIYGCDDVVMQYVTIRHAENPVYIHAPAYSDVHLNYSTIENCRNGIYWGSETYSEATDITNELWVGNNCIRNIGDDDHENPGIFIKGNLKTVVIDSNDISGCYGGIYASFSYTSNQMQYTLPSGILINHNLIHDLYSDDSTACGIKITDNSIKYRPATLPYGKIVNNTIDGIDGYGIKAKRHESGLWYIKNTIISEIGEWNSGAGYAVYNIGGGNLPIHYSTFYAVEETIYGCSVSNLVLDNPDYVSASDYHLQSCSPCIDAGDPDTDGDGYTWTTDNDDRDPDGTRMDIGALYCDYPPSIPTGFDGIWYNNHPKVYWTAVGDPDLDYYEVWKRRDGVWSLKTTTTALYYIDTGEDKWTKPMAMETIYYRVRSVDEGENSSGYTLYESFIVNNKEFDKEEFFPTVELDPIPTEFCLHSAYPNPFNATTTLKLDLPEETRFSLAIYDISGKEVWRLNNRRMNIYPAGYHTIQWDGHAGSGAVVPTGVYFIVYRSTEHQLNQKVVLVK